MLQTLGEIIFLTQLVGRVQFLSVICNVGVFISIKILKLLSDSKEIRDSDVETSVLERMIYFQRVVGVFSSVRIVTGLS